MKRLLWLLALGLGLALICGLTGWRVLEAVNRRLNTEESTDVAATPVEVMLVAPRDLQAKIRVAGTLRPLHEADLSAQVPGRVVEINAGVGDRVSRGQALLRVDQEQLLLQVRQARAGLSAAKAGSDAAERDLAAATTMVEAGGLTQAQWVAAKSRASAAAAQVEQAQAGLESAQSRLSDAVLRAPFSGVVVHQGTDIGRELAPGLPAFRIADLSSLELVVSVDEQVAAQLQAGDPVGIFSDTVAALPDGAVKTIAPTLDPVTHKAEVVVGLAWQPGLFGHAGATAEFRLARAEGVVAVPSHALLEDKGEHVVYLLEGEKVRRIVVKPGLRDGDLIEITGVPVGASVVVSGNTWLSEGAIVTIRATEPS